MAQGLKVGLSCTRHSLGPLGRASKKSTVRLNQAYGMTQNKVNASTEGKLQPLQPSVKNCFCYDQRRAFLDSDLSQDAQVRITGPWQERIQVNGYWTICQMCQLKAGLLSAIIKVAFLLNALFSVHFSCFPSKSRIDFIQSKTVFIRLESCYRKC